MRITNRLQSLPPKQKAQLPYLVLMLSVFAAYASVYQNGFVWDDMTLIVGNDNLRHWGNFPRLLEKLTLGPYYRPVQGIFYFFIYQVFGLSAAAFHFMNILLQAVNTCLVYRLGCRLGFLKRAAFAAALMWGMHPLWIEAVAVAAGTADLLVVFFFMTGLLVLLPDFKPRKIWLASLFFILALGSKESAIVFPALATFTFFLVSRERLKAAAYLRTWPLWLIGTAYTIGWVMCPALNNFASYVSQNDVYVETYKHVFINRVFTSLATLPDYFRLMFTPADLHVAWWDFPIFTTLWNWQVITGAAIVTAALVQIARARGKKDLPLTWGLLWFAAALSPYTGIFKPVDGFLFEHWIYIPAIGFFLGLSQTAAVRLEALRLKKMPVIAAGLVVLAALLFGTKTFTQTELLHDQGTMFENIIKYDPESAWARDNLATFYFDHDQFEKAAAQWHALEGLDYSPFISKDRMLYIHNALAFIYLNIMSDKNKTGVSYQEMIDALPSSTHIAEAIEELKTVQELAPDACCASQFLAGIYYYQGNKDKGDYYKALAEKILPQK